MPVPAAPGAAGAAADTAAAAAPDPPAFEREITWTAGDLELAGHLAIPDRATGAGIPGATRLFEEPGALEQVAEPATGWFTSHRMTQAGGMVPAG